MVFSHYGLPEIPSYNKASDGSIERETHHANTSEPPMGFGVVRLNPSYKT
jgi:hypothetical protein